jgi:eukaryotic-like serine/threonine-protein kinase
MSLAVGTRLGPYEILSPLGAGGMGEVYRARDTRLERTVAIKVLPSQLSSSPEVRQRFEREAKTISQLSHPHICALYDVGNQDGVEYLVMEYLEGETLADRLSRGPLPLEQMLRYGMEMADALDRAHRQGVVHRDLKPGNVMLTKSGVKLLDFGLAKAMAPFSSPSSLTALPTQAPDLTAEGTLLGTLQYMAPEQLEGKEADARTDIFAFGAVLYEMGTGRKAFSGASQASLISAIMSSEPPPLSTLQPMTPPALDRLIRRCLAKDAERRWQSAGDIALELEEIRETGEVPPSDASRAPRRRRETVGWLAAALLLLGLLGALVLSRRARDPAPAASIRFTIPPPPGAAFQGMPAISPDGRRLAFVATTSDGRELLWTRPLEALEARALEGTDGAAYPFWSPDGRFVAFFAQRKLKRIDVSGGIPQILCDAPEPRGGSWGSRGTIVFSANTGGQIARVAESGGRAEALPHLGAASGQSYRWPSFLRDGSNFLYFAFGADPKASGVYVASLESKETTRLALADGGAIFASPGYVLYPSGGRLMGQRFDANRRRIAGEAFPLMDNISIDSTGTIATAVSASDTGLLACQTGGPAVSQLLLYDRSGRELRAVGPAGSYWEPTFSPDGRRLAMPRMDPEALEASIWTIDLERGGLARLSWQRSVSTTPLWSPDGRRILYSTYPSGEVYVRDANGAEPEKLLFKTPSFTPLDDWSRDGRYIFYDVIDWRAFHTDVWARDLQSGASRPILQAKFNQSGARLSPDGRRLAYESDESGVFEIFVRSYPEPGERRQISTGGGRQPRWRGDGKELFFVSPDRKVMGVDIQTQPAFEAGAPRVLFQTRILPLVEVRNHYDVSSDGQRFVVNSRRLEDASLPITIVVNWASELKK